MSSPLTLKSNDPPTISHSRTVESAVRELKRRWRLIQGGEADRPARLDFARNDDELERIGAVEFVGQSNRKASLARGLFCYHNCQSSLAANAADMPGRPV
jgi:hypothetical protein